MHVEGLRDYALSLGEVTEGFPFGESTLVMKINNKIFLFISLDALPHRFSVKADPEEIIRLREEFPEKIIPGYHLNKKHWNTVILDGPPGDDVIKTMVQQSYDLVKQKKK